MTAALARAGAEAAAGAASDSFTLRLFSSVTPAAELQDWFDGAPAWPAPAGAAVYATGAVLPRGEPGVVLVQALVARGLAETHQVRDPADSRRFNFIVRKTGAAVTDGGSGAARERGTPPAKRTSRAATDREQERALMALLRQAAERGLPCPSNGRIAEKLQLGPAPRGRNRAQYLLDRAETRGKIRVETRGNRLPRVVTIVAKGRACGLSTRDG